MRTQSKLAGAFLIISSLLATTACESDGDGGEEPDGDEARLLDALNEGAALEGELLAAESRVIAACMEEQGFTVHDQNLMQPPDPVERTSLVDYYPYDYFLPSPEDARQWGFGQWASTPDGSESDDLQDYLDAHEDDQPAWTPPDNSAWEALTPQEQYDWYLAFYGEEKGAAYGESLLTGEDGLAEDERDSASDPDAGAEGEIELGAEPPEEMPPGGCELEMIDLLYGEPRLVEGEDYSYWAYRPESPADEAALQQVRADYVAGIDTHAQAFLECVDGRGHPGWAFDELGYLPLSEYWFQIYLGDQIEGVTDGLEGVPAPPQDLPADFEGRKAYEIEVAVDFAECGDESGYRTAAETAWESAQHDFYSGVESELYAWQEEMTDALDRAQSILDR